MKKYSLKSGHIRKTTLKKSGFKAKILSNTHASCSSSSTQIDMDWLRSWDFDPLLRAVEPVSASEMSYFYANY